MKINILKFIGLIIGACLLSNSNQLAAQAKYIIHLSDTTSSNDISEVCNQALFHVLEDINSKEPQHIDISAHKYNDRLNFSLILSKDNVMASNQLQLHWSNILYQHCPNISEVGFGKANTDWIKRYIEKNNKMVSIIKNKPEVQNMPYGEARKQIIAAGWKPVKAKNYNYESQYMDAIEAKYPEIFDCAGAGGPYCIFFFEDPDDLYYLKIMTEGEFSSNYDGKVSVIEEHSAMGGTEYGEYGQN